MKAKPLLVHCTRHEIPGKMRWILSGYNILHLTGRYHSPLHMVDTILAACGKKHPHVISAIMPRAWRIPFIQQCRLVFPEPGVTIVRPVFAENWWTGWFVRYNAPFTGGLFETVWIPNGPNIDYARELAKDHLDYKEVQVE